MSRRALDVAIAKYADGARWSDGKYYRYYLFTWNVKMYTWFTFDQVLAEMVRSEYYHSESEAIIRIKNIHALRYAWEHEDEVREVMSGLALDTMRRTFTDDETMKWVTPQRAARWGLGENSGPWDVAYDFVGRSGGHLALTRFAGTDLTGVTNEVPEMRNINKKALCAMLEEINEIVSRRDEEYLYQLAFNVRYNLPEFIPEVD